MPTNPDSNLNLFKPIKVGRLSLQNRVVLAPLTRSRAPKHLVTPLQVTYYEQRASRPGTLLITEATFISEAASGYPTSPGIYRPEHIEAWRPVFKAIHDKGSFVFVQLWALGRAALKKDLDRRGLPLVSASSVPEFVNNPSGPIPHALTREEIKQYVRDYANAAKNAIEAGADGVEIHSANGYLLDQFLHENTNQRTDEYGGSVENRARFVLEVVDAASEAIGADRVAIRLSPWGVFGSMDPGVSPIPQFSYVITELQKRANAGHELAYLHLVDVRWSFKTNVYDDVKLEGNNDFARLIWKGVLIRASGYVYKSAVEETQKDDKLLIGMGRLFISNPDLIDRWEQGIELNAYNRATFYTKGAAGFTDYPFITEGSQKDPLRNIKKLSNL